MSRDTVDLGINLPPNLAGVSEDAATSKRLSNGHMRVAGHLAH